ncbi:site-specific DNA-methyltransferase [Blastomonas sp. SL216]|uniref:site-specific DNA-methyltransferase n=1 Tax=Blastomonas sp. SL216 TaxID=2995169 RepID=UPI002376EB5E|nr:site-specific DNA-methyltransferase [Blastomonas sp. SL216]
MPILDWMTRGEDVRAAAQVPYRLLEAVPSLDGGDSALGNMLIQGDNLDALKALLPYYKGAVKCIYIDPPYNTRSAFEHYDDNLEHSQWLAMIYPRLVLLRELLAEDGSIWVSIDDNEAHYLKVIMDEVFGRRNFIATNVTQRTLTRRNDATSMSVAHDYVIAYAANINRFVVNRLQADERQRATYTNRDDDPRGDWLAVPFHAPNIRPNLTYPIETPSGRILMPPAGRCWSTTKEAFEALLADNRIYFGKDGSGMAQRKKFWKESEQQVVPWTWWPYTDVGENREATREAKELIDKANPLPIFSGPKPERLMQRILHIASNPGDLVLDSFLGSGTTAAVAHKMGRRWIGIEMGDHAVTHCKPRLDKVIDGEQGGVSEAVGWTGGGGYRFYRLGDPVFDADGHITDGIRFPTLAAHIWFSETGTPYAGAADAPVLGVHEGMAYALLYNGILGDRSVSGGNVLTAALLDRLRGESGWDGPMTVYGEWSKLGNDRLQAAGVTFKQTPYDVRAR